MNKATPQGNAPPKPPAPLATGGSFVPGQGFVSNKPKVIVVKPKPQAPYRTGQSPAEKAAAAAAANPAVHATVVSEPAARQNAQTKSIQRLLNANGYHVAVDGVYGPQTSAAYNDYLKRVNAQTHATQTKFSGGQQFGQAYKQAMATPRTADQYLVSLHGLSNKQRIAQLQADLKAGHINDEIAQQALTTFNIHPGSSGFLAALPRNMGVGMANMVRQGADFAGFAPPSGVTGEGVNPANQESQNIAHAGQIGLQLAHPAYDLYRQATGQRPISIWGAASDVGNIILTVAPGAALGKAAKIAMLLKRAGGTVADAQEMADAAALARATPLDTPMRTEMQTALMGSKNMTDAEIADGMHAIDTSAYIIAKQLGITPEQALYRVWDGAEHVPTTGVPESYPNAKRLNDVGMNPNARAAVFRNPRGEGMAPSHTLVVTNRTALSSLMHELMHAIEPHLPPDIRLKLQTAFREAGGDLSNTVAYDEFVARNFEAWLSEGKAATPGMQSLLDRIAPRIQEIYAKSGGVPASSALTDDLRNIFHEITTRGAEDASRATGQRGRIANFMNWDGLGAARKELLGSAKEMATTNPLKTWRDDFNGTTLHDIPEEHAPLDPTGKDLELAARRLVAADRKLKTSALPPGFRSAGKMAALLKDLQRRAIEAAAYRKWYEESAGGILNHVNGDVAEATKISQLNAIYSPQSAVYKTDSQWNNLDRALMAYDDYKRTGKVSPAYSISKSANIDGVKTDVTGTERDWQTHAAQKIMEGNAKHVEERYKTNRFHRNFLQHIDPVAYKAEYGTHDFATIDTWMQRAYKYVEGMGKKSISPAQYAFMEKATAEVAKSLGWMTSEAQAAIWTSIKAELEGTPLSEAGFNLGDAFAHRAGPERAAQIAQREIVGRSGQEIKRPFGFPKDKKQIARAEQWLAHALREDPGNPELAALAEKLDAVTEYGNSPDPETLFDEDPLVGDMGDAQGIKPEERTAQLEAAKGKDLIGIPEGSHSNAEAQALAESYMKKAGLDYNPPTTYAKVDKARAAKIAEWYDKAESAPHDPKVRAAYDAMAKETLAQYHEIVANGYTFEFYPEGYDPYPVSPSQAIDDLRANKHMFVYPTEAGFGTMSEADRAHPLLQDSGVKWGGKTVTHNDIFRAVHDFFGHYKEGNTFRSFGEENAWRSHSAMYSEQARGPMTAETRGQNSWLNYGPHGEANRTAKTAETVFADQKAVIAPDWVVNEGAHDPAVLKDEYIPPEEGVPNENPFGEEPKQEAKPTPKHFANVPETDNEYGLTKEQMDKAVQEYMKAAGPGRTAQDASDAEARAKVAARAEAALRDPTEPSALQRHFNALAEMKGQLPVVDWEGKQALTPQKVEAMTAHIQSLDNLGAFSKQRATNALLRAFQPDVRPPTEAEFRLLEKIFGKQPGLRALAAQDNKWRRLIFEVLNIPRAIMASFDLSAPLRQGLILGSQHPIIAAGAFKDMLKMFASETFYRNFLDGVELDPNVELMDRADLARTDMEHASSAGTASEEEAYAFSNLAEKIVSFKPGDRNWSPVRWSGRAYTGFLVKLRTDVFNHLIEEARATGIDVEHNDKFLRDLGNFINAATGRGQVLKKLEGSLDALNTAFFSPRLMASRMNFLNFVNPENYLRLDPFVRKQKILAAMTTAGAVSGFLALASQIPGVSVNLDPRNADFGKIKIGDTRIDVAGGFQQYIHLMGEIATRSSVSSTTGRTTNLFGGKYGQKNLLDVLTSFMEGKAAPLASTGMDIFRGKDAAGKPIGVTSELESHFIPLIGQDMKDIYKDPPIHGVNPLMAAFLGYGAETFGTGVQTYKAQPPGKASIAKTESEAKALGWTEPSFAHQELLNESALRSISTNDAGNKDKAAREMIAYYKKTTGYTAFDRLLKQPKFSDVQAARIEANIRAKLVHAGTRRFEAKVKKATAWNKEHAHG